jgi:hypothetical protein
MTNNELKKKQEEDVPGIQEPDTGEAGALDAQTRLVTTAEIIVFDKNGKVHEHFKINQEGKEEPVKKWQL